MIGKVNHLTGNVRKFINKSGLNSGFAVNIVGQAAFEIPASTFNIVKLVGLEVQIIMDPGSGIYVAEMYLDLCMADCAAERVNSYE